MKIVLIGFSCAYKTCAGKILAEKLGYNFIDTDETLERRTGMGVAEIFARNGEERFREEENALLYELAESDCGNAVIACGGGSPLCSGFRALACNAAVVLLTVGVDYVLSRLDGVSRPLSDGLPRGSLQALMDERSGLYAEFARFTVNTDGLTSVQTAELLYSELCKRI